MKHTWPLMCVVALVAAGCTQDQATTSLPPLPPCTAPTPVALAVGEYTSIDPASDSGCVSFPANASTTDSASYLVVVQSVGGTPGDSAPFQLRNALAPYGTPRQIAAAQRPRRSVSVTFDRFLRRVARQSALAAVPAWRPAPLAGPPGAPPVSGTRRTFTVCADLDCGTFKPVTAVARSVGAHVAIYVDTLAPAGGFTQTDLDSLQQVLDGRLYPIDTLAFGRESDIDGNSVVIVLLTGVVNAMVSPAACDTGGFVEGFFFAPDIDPATAAQYNDGEVIYALVPDSSATLSCAHRVSDLKLDLPPTFLHEFEHMISYTQHVLVRGGPPEDDWLDEGLSEYAEELGGRSYLPFDPTTFGEYTLYELYDAYTYLRAPEQHFLLTTSDQSLADLGAGWLFVRYLVDQYGPALASQLVQTSLVGEANVASHTGQAFATSVERWALANWVSDLPGFTAPAELRYTSWSFRQTFLTLYSLDPADFPSPFPLVPFDASGSLNAAGTLRAGSGVYLRLRQGPRGAEIDLRLNSGATPVSAALAPRVTIIRTH
jgi:hypothetical protein